jgi:carboxyl-terminal processing protease
MLLRSRAMLGLFALTFPNLLCADGVAEKALERVWTEAKAHVYPAALSRRFDDATFRRLRRAAKEAPSLEAFADTLNAFLDTLGRSHTRFMPTEDPDEPFFRSLFGTRDVDAPAAWHLGAQYARSDGHWIVRAVLDGGPAAKAGLRRGDRVTAADGRPFHPVHSVRGRRSVVLAIERGREKWTRSVDVDGRNPHRAFVEATRRSARVVAHGGKRIGYVHLWTGTAEANLAAFREAVGKASKDVDALVLDLRDGFGGAWWPYLDDFYPDSSGYFKATRIDRDGSRRDDRAPVRRHERWYAGPLVVLVNEGTRSGKEALAQFFKTSGRATLVGANTAGAVCVGRIFFADEDAGFLLYLSAGGVEIDGVDLEGTGVAPHRRVTYPLDHAAATDPQLDAALDTAASLARG